MNKPYWVYETTLAMNKPYFYVVDVPGYVYGAGYSEEEAVNAAIKLGISPAEIDSEVI